MSKIEIDMITAYRSSNEIGRKAIESAVPAIAKQSPVREATNGSVVSLRDRRRK